MVRGQVWHNDRELAELGLEFAGRTSVFAADFELDEVERDYEVMRIRVTASEAAALNFGSQVRSYKLTP